MCPSCSAPKSKFEALRDSKDPTSSRPVKEYPVDAKIALPGAGSTVDLRLISKVDVSSDTRIFRFGLPSENHILGLPVGQHVMITFTDDAGNLVSSPYTPISSDDDVGYVDFCIKIYRDGAMSQKLDSLALGETMAFDGPLGNVTYTDRGEFSIYNPATTDVNIRSNIANFVMVCGGTGITPMLQVIRQIFKDVGDTTRVFLLFANKTPSDILLKDDLDSLAKQHPNLQIRYTVDSAEGGPWDGSVGLVDVDMINECLPASRDGTQVLMCGPPQMLEQGIKPALRSLGFAESSWIEL